MPPRHFLAELRAKALLEQEARTADRIGRLFMQRAPQPKRRSPSIPAAPLPPHDQDRYQSSGIDEAASPLLAHRGKASKWYGIRVGRKPGICNDWAECKARVDGISCAEFRSFRTAKEAIDYVKAANLGRMVNYMNLTTSKTSFVGGRAMRAIVRVVQQGETTTREHICCLDSGSDFNLASRDLLHDVRRIDAETISISSEETMFEEERTLFLLVAGTVKGVPALVATTDRLPYECDMLLGVPGVDDLGVQLDDHRGKKIRRLERHVDERTLRTWLESNGTKEVPKVSFDIDEVQFNPDLSEDLKGRVRALLKEYEDVFAGEQDSLPKPFAAEPVELKFVSNPEPQSVPEPRWTFAQKQILTSWAEEGLRTGHWNFQPPVGRRVPTS